MKLEELADTCWQLQNAVEHATGIRGAVAVVAIQKPAFDYLWREQQRLFNLLPSHSAAGLEQIKGLPKKTRFIKIHGIRLVSAEDQWPTDIST